MSRAVERIDEIAATSRAGNQVLSGHDFSRAESRAI